MDEREKLLKHYAAILYQYADILPGALPEKCKKGLKIWADEMRAIAKAVWYLSRGGYIELKDDYMNFIDPPDWTDEDAVFLVDPNGEEEEEI